MVPKRSDFPALLRPEGAVAVKELCESLESTRSLLAERAGLAQHETTTLEPLPQDRRSLAFVKALFKHNLSPSNIEDAIIALKDFQFEVESCQQTTELAFQKVWTVYEIIKSQTLQRSPSVSPISSNSTQMSESPTQPQPQATTGFRRETIDWLKGLVASSKPNSDLSIHISKPSELPTSNLSEQDRGLGASRSGPSSEVVPIALTSSSQAYNAPGPFTVESPHLSVSASLSGSEGMQRRGLGDDRLLPHGSSSRDSRPDDTSYRPRKCICLICNIL